jgi:hypothetical protein
MRDLMIIFAGRCWRYCHGHRAGLCLAKAGAESCAIFDPFNESNDPHGRHDLFYITGTTFFFKRITITGKWTRESRRHPRILTCHAQRGVDHAGQAQEGHSVYAVSTLSLELACGDGTSSSRASSQDRLLCRHHQANFKRQHGPAHTPH